MLFVVNCYFLSGKTSHRLWGQVLDSLKCRHYMDATQGTLRSFVDDSERASAVDCLVHAVVPYYLVLCVSEGKNTNIFPNGQIIYAINVPRSE